MILSRWGGRIILATMLAVVLAVMSMTLPLFAVGIEVDSLGQTRDEAVVYREHVENGFVWSGLTDYSHLGTTMTGFTAMIWIWMLLALVFVGLLLLNTRRSSVICGWVLVINSLVALLYLTAGLGASSGSLVHYVVPSPDIRGFYGHVTSSTGVEWTWGPAFGWWFLVVAVVLQALAVTIRTYTVFHEYQVQRRPIEPPPVQDSPKPT